MHACTNMHARTHDQSHIYICTRDLGPQAALLAAIVQHSNIRNSIQQQSVFTLADLTITVRVRCAVPCARCCACVRACV